MTEGVRAHLARAAAAALAEDLAGGGPEADVTTVSTVAAGAKGRGEVVAKADGIVCGLASLEVTFDLIGPDVAVEHHRRDGDRVAAGDVLATCEGTVRTMLTGERTALNILGHLSGVATAAAAFVERAPDVAIADTRKTLPGLRAVEKYAVRIGGGVNHRFALWDAVLVKDNHIVAAGGIAEATRLAKAATSLPVQVECESLEDVATALDAGADAILIDNFTPEQAADAVEHVKASGRDVTVEASGGVTLDTVGGYAAAGVDRISVGALTHSAPALDVSFRLTESN